MANLRFLKNVTHNGMTIMGERIENNIKVFGGSIVDLDQDSRGLKQVAQDLVDRGVAEFTNDEATHTTALVNAAQQAMPKGSPASAGSPPVADSIKRNMDYQKQLAAEKAGQPIPGVQTNATGVAQAALTPPPVAAQPSAEEIAAAQAQAQQAPASAGQPTAEEIAAAADAAA